MKKRILSLVLSLCMVIGLLPGEALAAARAATVQDAHACGNNPTRVTSFAELQRAVNNRSRDIILSPASGDSATWNVTAALSVSSTVHIRVEEGKTVTLKRNSSNTNINLFNVAAGGHLILGDGAVSYEGSSLKEAAEQGNYTIGEKSVGKLVIDGGATWTKGDAYKPGDDALVMYDENGIQYQYTYSATSSAALVQSSGTLDVWDGVTLQNNVMSNGTNSYGSAIQSMEKSTLNFFGGEVSRCAVVSSNGDTGRGAVFIGTFVPGNWSKKPDITESHFNMYGGAITRNSITSNNQDGGGVSVETGYMDLYGGEISYNHGGLSGSGATGDGGGIMVRNNAQFTMWGGSVSNNFTGGYGGGIVAWNAQVNINGGSITQNKAAYGGGVAVASSNNDDSAVTSLVTMKGGEIAYNEAINSINGNAGVGGGICVGTGSRVMGCSLELQGGVIRQNTAVNGGGMGIYAGGGQNEGSIRNTSAALSGDFQMISNSADQHGGGMYIANTTTGNRHYLVKMSGGARIDTNNPVYFENVCSGQIPVQVTDTLTTTGTAAIFEFSDSFWSGNPGDGYQGAGAGLSVVDFAKDIQENKIALESTDWYLKAESGDLKLYQQSSSPLYTIRNGTPVKVNSRNYYRIYASLSDAVNEAADGDTLYIFYNTTIDAAAKVSGKHLTLMAESTSSAGRDAGLSGSGATKTCWLENTDYGYVTVRGNFLQYVGTGGTHNKDGGTTGTRAYTLTNDANGAVSYNVRNDYTITLSSRLYLGDSKKGGNSGEAAIVVENGASLDIGQTSEAGMGAGALTFDGNLSYPKEGPMFQTSGVLNFHSGVTVMYHSNYSEAHPGTVEVRANGAFTMEEGSRLSGNVSPIAGAVYNNGTFTLNGGTISGNTGAMPRYGFFNASGSRSGTGYDSAYWGQGKYYLGAGAVYNTGTFTMKGGTVENNIGEYGAIANLAGSTTLSGGSVTGNRAVTGTGSGEQSLKITGYTEGANPAVPAASSPDAGSGGGLYVGGGSASLGAASITGNFAQNGGGAAAGSGTNLVRAVTSYSNVNNANEQTTTGTTPAKVPVYGNAGGTVSHGQMELQSGASLSGNTAEELGGGLFVTGNGSRADVLSGVTLQRNTAKYGGGVAAAEQGSIAFSNEIMENTAVRGGGVYVGAESEVTARGSITANTADYGGGAYVDCAGSPDPAAPGSGETGFGTLTLDGAVINNNRLNGAGLGIGVYSRGNTVLTAQSGVQPLVSYNDRIYMERGRVLTVAASYDVEASGQTANNRLTLETRDTANGTQVVAAASPAQAQTLLTSRLLAHYTHYLAINVADGARLELNSVPIYYYDRFQASGNLDSHRVEVPYAAGDTVILRNFGVGENHGFTAPEGMSFLYWVTIDQNGKYLDFNGNETDDVKNARIYYAGNSITNLTAPAYLEAVYGTVQYYATLQVLDENGNVVNDNSMGTIGLDGATHNSSTGDDTYAMGTPMTISVTPAKDANDDENTLLQELIVYVPTDTAQGTGDINVNNRLWTPIITSVMETETLEIPVGSDGATSPQTVISTGKLKGLNLKNSEIQAELDENGNILYTASSSDILIRARLKKGMVRLDVAGPLAGRADVFNPVPAFTGYYDTMLEAVTAAGARIKGEGGTDNSYTFTLLAPNPNPDDPGAKNASSLVVRYYGDKGEDAANCIDNDIVSSLENKSVHLTYNLMGYALDYQKFGERNLKNYDMTIKNGTVLYHGGKDKTLLDGTPKPSAFRVAEGTLTLDNVSVITDGTPEAGCLNDKVYSAKVMEGGTLNIGQGCHLEDVYIFTDEDEIKEATPEKPSKNSGHVTVTSTFVEGRTESVATLCMDYWEFPIMVRKVIDLTEDVAASQGVSIRRLFGLKDVDADKETDEARYWFIGTDGRLYLKAAAVEPTLSAVAVETGGGSEDGTPINKYWDYTNKNGHAEIGDGSHYKWATDDGHVNWVDGYPFYYDYTSDYGYDNSKYNVSLEAKLLDGKGAPIELNRGSISFTVSRVIHDGDTTTNRRNFGGSVGVNENGEAHLAFSTLAALPTTAVPDTENWTRPDSYYVISALWSGSGQYAPQYAEYWNYSYGVKDTEITLGDGTKETISFKGISGGTLVGAVRLSHLGKALTEPDVKIVDITPRSAEYIGPEGVKAGYTSAPNVGRVQDTSLNAVMNPDIDYKGYYAALTPKTEGEPAGSVVRGADGSPLVCELTDSTGNVIGEYYYMAGELGGKIYYTIGGAGNKDGTSPANAFDLNGAPAGPYSVAMEAETISGSSYTGQSGWKDTLFTIRPYSSSLSIEGLNHVVVPKDGNYQETITKAFNDQTRAAKVKVTDRYGNELPLEDCAFTFEPINGSAQIGEDGFPSCQGLYNLKVTASGHGNGVLKLDGVTEKISSNPNYADTAAGYLMILITNTQLDVFFVPETVSVPYTGRIYTSDDMKAYDGKEDGYEVWRVEVDENGRPLNEAGSVIEVEKIPQEGRNRLLLTKNEYRVEIGSPQHTPRDVGTYTTVVTDIAGGYIGIGSLNITAQKLGTLRLGASSGVYTGANHSPAVTVTNASGQALTLNRDYIIQITDRNNTVVNAPVNAGEYTYTAIGINNYVGSERPVAKYTVVPKRLDNTDENTGARRVILDAPSYALVNSSQATLTPRYSLYYNGMTLVRGADAAADYSQVITSSEGHTIETITGSGSYTFTITGKGNYTGTVTFHLLVGLADGDLRVTNTDTFTYNGSNFASYDWENTTTVLLMREGGTTETLDPYRFDVAVYPVDSTGNISSTPVPADAVLDAGVYRLTLTPKEDYLEENENLKADDRGYCVLQIERREVTITLPAMNKAYGTPDPDFSASNYVTDLPGTDLVRGFYPHDTGRITGSFFRNTGEDVRNSGYRYTLGSFSAGDNYLLTVSLENVFSILPKDLSVPAEGVQDEISVNYQAAMSYTGYSLDAIRSVSYQPEAASSAFSLVDQANYHLSYQRWIPGTDGCTPDCQIEGCAHSWEDLSVTPANVGWYRVTIDADACITTPDNYVGSRSYIYEIRAQGGALELAVDGEDSVTYRSKENYKPIVSVRREGFALSQEYYTLSYSFAPADGSATRVGTFVPGQTAFRDAGVYTIFASGRGNYAGSSGNVDFTIKPKNLAENDEADETVPVEARITDGQTFIYDGTAKQAGITAAYDGISLKETDYTLSYQNHVNAGTAALTVTGRGNYTGTRTLTYPIAKQPLSVTVNSAVKVYGCMDPTYRYDVKNAQGQAVNVRLTGTVERAGGENVGRHVLAIGTLSAGSNYDLKLAGAPVLEITEKSLGNGAAAAENISVAAPSYLAVGTTVESLKASVSVTYWAPALSQQTLKAGTDYEITVTRGADGTGSEISDTTQLAAGDYTIRIDARTGGNYSGGFTLPVKVIDADSLINLGSGDTRTYSVNGYEIKLTPQVNNSAVLEGCIITLLANGTSTNLTQAADGSFTFRLSDAGTYTVTVLKTTSDKTYLGTVTYVVLPKDISDDNEAGDGRVSTNEPEGDFSYTGNEVTLTNANTLLVYGGKTIPAREDGRTNYEVGYSGNVNPGTATATIYGQGNYTGTREVHFTVGEVRYRIAYHRNGGTGAVPVDNGLYLTNAMATVQGNTGGLTGAEKTVFLGWSTIQIDHPILSREELDGDLYVSGSLYQIGLADVTLYAVWAADTNLNGIADCDEDKYTVTYQVARDDACTGIVPTESAPYLGGATVTVRSNVGNLALEGYLLLGWAPGVEGMSSLKLNTSDEFFTFANRYDLYGEGRTFAMGQGNVVLSAVWGADANKNGTVDWMEREVQYFVTYDGNGGGGALPASRILDPGVMSVSPVIPGDYDKSGLTRNGYTLLGWTVTKEEPLTAAPGAALAIYTGEAGEAPYVIPSDASNPVVFYALWAVDENHNDVADYLEDRHIVSYHNAMSDKVTAVMPNVEQGQLEGMTILLPTVSEGTTTTDGKTTYLTFLGWTETEADAQKIYTRGTKPEQMLEPGAPYQVGNADTTFYAVWGEADYNRFQYLITVTPTPTEGGTAVSDKAAVLEGESAEIAIVAKDGYALSQVLINGKAEPLPESKDGAGREFALSLTEIHENKSVVVTFVRSDFRAAWPASVTYNGTRQAPELKVYRSDNTAQAVDSSNYQLSVTLNEEEIPYEDAFVDAGNYIITITGKAEYSGSRVQVPYVISPARITELTLTEKNRPYVGNAYADEIASVKAGSLTLGEGDYTAEYRNNINTGTATVTVTGQGNFTGTLTKTFTISAADKDSLKAAWEQAPSITYDGQPHRPVPAVTVNGNADLVLTENVDYELSYPKDAANAGEKKVTVIGKGNFAGASAELTYEIKQKSLAEGDTADGTEPVQILPMGDRIYTGGAITPEAILLYGSSPVLNLTAGEDFTVAYSANTEVGEAKAVVTGTGNYTGSREAAFRITPAGSGMSMVDSVSRVYNGSAQLLSQTDLQVKAGEKELALNTDYEVSYTAIESTGAELANGAPRNAGTYVVIVKGRGSYTGTIRGTLIITPAVLSELTVDETSFLYDGAAHAPEITAVKAGNLTLEKEDYTVAYRDSDGNETSSPPTEAGSYTLVVTGKGNYTGSRSVSFSISKGKILNVGAVSNKVYDGLPYQPHPEITSGSRKLAENVDYTLKYPDDVVNAGDKSVAVTGVNNYEDSTAGFTYTIERKSVSDEDITVTVADQTYTGEALEPEVIVTHKTVDGRVLFLTKDVDFTVAYSDNTAAGTATVTITGKGNYTDTRPVTFQITSAESKTLTVTSEPASKVYSGTVLTPDTITVTSGETELQAGTDYTVSYQAVTGKLDEAAKEPLHAGTYYVMVEGKGNYQGANGLATFIITPAQLGGVTVEDGSLTYTGSEQEPAVTVTDGNGKELTEGTDYTLEYRSNENAGTATVVVTGQGDYTGGKTASFTILPKTVTVTPTKTGKTYGEADGELTYSAEPSIRLSGALARAPGENAGEYAFDAASLWEGTGNYTVALKEGSSFTIEPKSLADSDVVKTGDLTVGYTGSAFSQSVAPVYNAALGTLYLSKDKDYTVSYEKGGAAVTEAKEPGAYTVKVAGKDGGNYTDSFTFTLTITRSRLGVTLAGDTVTYECGKNWADDMLGRLTASFNSQNVPLTAANLSYRNAAGETVTAITDAGTYTVVVNVPSYDEVQVPFHVLPKNIGSADVTATAASAVYDGTPRTTTVALKDGAAEMTDTDYTVISTSYENNINTGTAQVLVAGKGNYTGTRTVSFQITPAALPATITAPADVEYNGTVQREKPGVPGLVEGEDYTLDYSGDLIHVGEVTVTVTGRGNYSGDTETVTYEITPRELQNSWITVIPNSVIYTGSEQTPAVQVVDGQRYLVEGTDYTLSYSSNTNIGSAEVTVTAIAGSDYTGTATGGFAIVPSGNKALLVSSTPDSVAYDGTPKTATVTVTDGSGNSLTEGTDYTVSYSAGTGRLDPDTQKPLDAGSYYVVVAGIGNYDEFGGTAALLITPVGLGGMTVASDPLTYTGSEQKPAVTVTDGNGKELTEGTDYTLEYRDNTDAGTATAVVAGKGNYSGTLSEEFTIAPAQVTVTPQSSGKTYGQADGVLTYTVDHPGLTLGGTLTRAPGEDVGTYAFSVDSLWEKSGNYTLSLADGAKFAIAQKDLSDNDVRKNGNLNVGFTGSAFDQSIATVYGAQLGSLLLQDQDYEVKFVKDGRETAPVQPGTYTVTVTGKGNYTGSYEFTLTIDNGILGVVLTGDTVTYERGRNWADDMPGRLAASFNGKNVPLTAGNLSCRNAAGEAVTAITDAGSYTVVVSVPGYDEVTVPFHVLPKDISGADVTAEEIPAVTYTGSEQTPSVTLKDGSAELTGSLDFTAAYENNTNAGTARVILTGTGNYTGARTETFTINTGALPGITAPGDVEYTGEAQPQKPIVPGLMEGRDYTLSYAGDFTNVGTVTVTVTGQGNYGGTQAVSYRITPKSIKKTRITVIPSQVVYTGSEQKPAVQVVDGQRYLVEGVDYTLDYQNNIMAGDPAAVVITGIGNYSDTQNAAFVITAAESRSLTVAAEPAFKDYNGEAQEPDSIVVKDGDTVLVPGTDYKVTYRPVTGELNADGKPVNTDSYYVIVTGIGNYDKAGGLATLLLIPDVLDTVSVEPESLLYDGTAKTPDVTVTASGRTLTEGTDYTLRYLNNVNTGTATVVVSGLNNYTGTLSADFRITSQNVVITPTKLSKTYGEADGVLTYRADPDIRLSGALTRTPGEDVGSYDFSLASLREESGNYALSLAENVKFAIEPKSLADGEIVKTGDLTVGYTGSPFSQSVAPVYQSDLGTLLLTENDYTVAIRKGGSTVTEAKEPGEYEFTVAGKGNYRDSFTFTLTITNAQLGVVLSGDTVTYEPGKNWAADMRDRLSASFDGTSVSLENAALSYRNAAGDPVTEITNAGSYGVVVSVPGYNEVTVPFLVLPKDISSTEITAEAIPSVEYTGEAQSPELVLKDGATELDGLADYTAAYQNNLNAGTALGVVTGKGNYTGTRTVSFRITPKPLAGIQVSALPDVVYNGAIQLQAPEVTGLTEGRDYTLSHIGDLINVGEVTARITGQGNYTGTKDVTYHITPKTIQDDWVSVVPGYLVYTGSAQTPAVLVADDGQYLQQDADYVLRYGENTTDIGTVPVTVEGRGNYTGTAEGSFEIGSTAAVLTVGADRQSTVYNGADQKPVLAVTVNRTALTAGSGYTAQYTYNGREMGAFDSSVQFVDTGIYVITVTGVGSYAGSGGTVTYTILPAQLTMSPVADQDYTGGPVTPKPAVMRQGSTTPLVLNTDYVLSYVNNVALGEKTASVTATGLGNYAGSTATELFTITGENTLHSVNYDGNGHTDGTLPRDERGYLVGARATVLTSDIQRLNAVFLGWSLEKVEAPVTTREGQNAIEFYRPGSTIAVSGDMTLYAVWAVDANGNGRPDYAETVTVTAAAGEGGTISPEGRTTVAWGYGQLSYTITVQGGYSFSKLTVDGEEIALSTEDAPTPLTQQDGVYVYKFTDLIDDHTILASFTRRGGGGPNPPEEGDPTQDDLDRSGVTEWLETGNHIVYLQGRGNNMFYPNASLTRAEAAMAIYRLLKNKNVPITVHFDDVPDKVWYSTAVNTLASLGIIEGVGDNRFSPNRAITRAEFAAIISRLCHPVDVGEVRSFTDVHSGQWFYRYVQTAAHYGWISGYPDSSYGPYRNITRAEVAKIVNTMTGRLCDRKAIDAGEGRRYTDVTEKHWAFYEIIEASSEHDFTRASRVETWTKSSGENDTSEG